MEGSQEEAGLPIDVFSDEMVVLAFQLDSLLDDGDRDFQERRRCLNQLIMMDGTVTIVGKFLEDMTDACLRTDHRIPGNPQPLRQRYRRS